MQNIQYLFNAGKMVGVIDMTGNSLDKLKGDIADAKKALSLQADRSILALIKLSDLPFTDESILLVNKFIGYLEDYAARIAIVGLIGLRKVVLQSSIKNSIKKIMFFDGVDTAKDWLTT